MTQENNNSQNYNSQNMSSLDFTQENTTGSQLSQDNYGNADLSLNFGNDGAVELSQNSFDYFAGGMSTGLNPVGNKAKKSSSSGNRRNQSDNSQNDFTGQSQGPGNSMLSQDSNYGGNFDYQFSQN